MIEPDKLEDERGFFARAWCRQELTVAGIDSEIAQANLSYNVTRGTVRGMHWQRQPHAETKLVRCTRGRVYDVIIDLREASPTYKRWFGVELSQDNHLTLVVPKNFAHGYQTLTDNAEVYYLATDSYSPECEVGVRHDDPAFGIRWPTEVSIVSGKDASWPDFTG